MEEAQSSAFEVNGKLQQGTQAGLGTPSALTPPVGTKPQRAQMIKGVFLDKYKWSLEDGTTVFQWTCENTRFNQLNIEFDFTGSTNFNLNGPTHQKAPVPPYAKDKVVATIQQQNPEAAYSLKYAWTVGTAPPADEIQQQVCDKRAREIPDLLRSFEALHVSPVDTPADTVAAKCAEAHVSFVDKEFPPVDSSIAPPDQIKKFGKFITWRRPKEFMADEKDGKIELFKDSIQPSDIQQGRLGNCWFCCSLSALAEHPTLVERMFLPTKGANAGMYQLRLCKDGAWRTVTVDDYFPCYPEAGPIFSKNKGSELWVLLLEKAYAKLHGSYRALKSGRACDAMADLTGFPIDYFLFAADEVKKDIESGKFWQLLVSLAQQDQMMAAGTSGKEVPNDPKSKSGLVSGHAYSVLHCQEGLGHKLLKIRNPWGRFEWKGDWGDESPLWNDETKKVFNPSFKADDGVFWMSYKDFLANFDSLHVCYWQNGEGKAWFEDRADGAFVGDEKTGYRPAKDYLFTVTTRSRVSVTLYQDDPRLSTSAPLCDMAAYVVNEADGSVALDTQFFDTVQGKAIGFLEPGTYRISPMTTGCKMRLNKLQRKAFRVAIHADSEAAAKLTLAEHDPAKSSKALEHVVKAHGNKKACGDGVLFAYSHWSGTVMTYAISVKPDFNEGDVEVTLDCAKSKNGMSDRGDMAYTYTLKPGEFHIFHRLVPVDSNEAFSYTYSMSWSW